MKSTINENLKGSCHVSINLTNTDSQKHKAVSQKITTDAFNSVYSAFWFDFLQVKLQLYQTVDELNARKWKQYFLKDM